VDIASEDLKVQHSIEAGRFEIRYGDDLARLEYRIHGSTIVYTHTVVPPALERHGLAAKLAKHALEYARTNGLSVEPLCPYVANYIQEHPQYADLVALED